METTNLKQADTKVEVIGILSENKLEEVVKDGKKSIRGDIVIQTGDINFVTFSVFVSEKKNDGTDNPTYSGIKTVMEQYDSIAKVGKENASKVSVTNGQIRPNSYVGKDGQVHCAMRFQNTFFNRCNEDTFDPHAWFEVEMVISSVAPEVYTSGENQGEETGRAIVKGWLPTYNGIEPITLIAPEEDGIAEAILDDYKANDTVKFYGDIVNSRAEITEEIPVKIGKPRVRKRSIYKNEMIITNASDVYGEDSDTPTPEPYDIEAIRKAITERELKLEEEKNNAKQPVAASKSTRTSLPTF